VGDIAWTTAYDACREPRMGDRHIDLHLSDHWVTLVGA
jgi:hypothetical protein